MWLREGDAVIVKPWEYDNEKAEILFKYSLAAMDKLKRMGKLKAQDGEF